MNCNQKSMLALAEHINAAPVPLAPTILPRLRLGRLALRCASLPPMTTRAFGELLSVSPASRPLLFLLLTILCVFLPHFSASPPLSDFYFSWFPGHSPTLFITLSSRGKARKNVFSRTFCLSLRLSEDILKA